MKKFLAILVSVCILAICFAGCGSNKYADSPYVGTWHATTIESEDLGIQLLAEDFFDNFDLILDASGKVTLNINGDETKGHWKETDTGFSIQGMDFTVENNVATVVYQAENDRNLIIHCEK